MTVRVLDFGCVPPVTSLAVYHGVADALRPGDDPVITLCSPDAPYICVGALQDVAVEVDEAACRARGLPVLRREIGGGAVYLDQNQLFFHSVFPRGRAPALAAELFPWFIEPVLRVYRGLGIDAVYRPLNDIHVHGRKLGGTAAALIGDAVVLGGSVLFDFDGETMARCLKVPSEKFRDKLVTALADYMTTLSKLLPQPPPRALVRQRYLAEVAAFLGEPLRPDRPTSAERAAIAARERRLADPAFVRQRGRRRVADSLKVAAGLHLTEAAYKAPGGLIRVLLLERDGRIEDLDLSGDVTCLPADRWPSLARRLRGLLLDEALLAAAAGEAISALRLDLPGVTPADLARAVMAGRGSEGGGSV